MPRVAFLGLAFPRWRLHRKTAGGQEANSSPKTEREAGLKFILVFRRIFQFIIRTGAEPLQFSSVDTQNGYSWEEIHPCSRPSCLVPMLDLRGVSLIITWILFVLYFGGWTKKALFKQNKGHLGSRLGWASQLNHPNPPTLTDETDSLLLVW